MNKFKFKKNVLLKRISPNESLLLFLDNDNIYKMDGQSAEASNILYTQSKESGLTASELEKKLTESSNDFSQNENKSACIIEFIEQLKTLNLIETL